MVIVSPSFGALKSGLPFDGPIATPSHLPRAAATSSPSTEQSDADQAPKLRPLRRRERWQWSKGDGPGEYGGPPLDFRIRRIWGGEEKDPLTTTDDYIWKKEWQKHLEAPPSSESPAQAPQQEEQPEFGFLSLNRASALDSIDLDLTKELMKPAKSVLELQVEAVRDGLPTDEGIKQDKPRWRLAPTRREQKQWARARKAVPGGMAMLVPEVGKAREDPKVAAANARQDYRKLKDNLQLLTAVIGGAGAVCSYVSYSPEVATSYGVGLLGSLAYIRMLGNSVDSFGNSDVKGAVRGALGQPRQLVPVALVMLFNRWNEVLAPQYGFLHLQLIPILVGFFTYKAATVVEVFKDVLQGEEENV